MRSVRRPETPTLSQPCEPPKFTPEVGALLEAARTRADEDAMKQLLDLYGPYIQHCASLPVKKRGRRGGPLSRSTGMESARYAINTWRPEGRWAFAAWLRNGIEMGRKYV